MEVVVRNSELISEMEDDEFEHKPSDSKWSKKEILGHLIDQAYNNHHRFVRAQTQDNLIFQGYDQVYWVKANNYQNRDREEILFAWVAVNEHLRQVIMGIPEDVLTRKTSDHNFDKICMKRIPSEEESSLAYLIEDYIFPLEHHLGQIIPVS